MIMHPIHALSQHETFFGTLMRKLKSHRVIWCYIYLGLYVWMSVYAVLNYPASVNTVVMTTGGLCGTILSIYILGTSYENVKHGEQMMAPHASPEQGLPTDER